MTASDGGSSGGSSTPTRPTHRHLPPLQTPTHLLPEQPSQPHHGALLAAAPPLLLTVRFSTDLPDLLLDIPHPARTTVVALKHLIRSRLAQPSSQRRLRFIHGGKILPDTAIVASVLKPLPPPPPNNAQQQVDPKGKGKAVEGSSSSETAALQQQRVYVNCSIGDSLTDAELQDEKIRAAEPVPEAPARQSAAGGLLPLTVGTSGGGAGASATALTTQRGPRGFDRLLGANMSPAEVNQLRLQYRAIQGAHYTADTMPSPDTWRSIEDAWLDDNNMAGAAGPSTAEDGVEDGLAGMVDLLLKGMFIGFVWPLGALGWLVRGQEKIPKQMRVFVYCGFALSLLMGTIRVMG